MSVARSIVYFAYLGDEGSDGGLVRQRLVYMERQLAWLADLLAGGADPASVLVPYVAPRSWDDDVHRAIERHGFAVDAASVGAERRNTFEYRGFAALKALAEAADPTTLLYYCHSKGIVHLEELKMGLFRLHTRVGLTTDLAALIEDSAITRAGLFPSRFGWCWYNFFWIKAGRMARLPVEESADRYQFEALIGERGDKEGYRGVLPLIDRVPFEHHGIVAQPWYRPADTTTPTLDDSYARYARMASPPAA